MHIMMNVVGPIFIHVKETYPLVNGHMERCAIGFVLGAKGHPWCPCALFVAIELKRCH